MCRIRAPSAGRTNLVHCKECRTRCWLPATASDEPVHEQHQQGSTDRDPYAAQIEPRNVAEAEHVCAQEAPDKSTDDAEHDGEDNSATLLARHDEFGQRARDQPKENPRQNTHSQRPPGKRARTVLRRRTPKFSRRGGTECVNSRKTSTASRPTVGTGMGSGTPPRLCAARHTPPGSRRPGTPG